MQCNTINKNAVFHDSMDLLLNIIFSVAPDFCMILTRRRFLLFASSINLPKIEGSIHMRYQQWMFIEGALTTLSTTYDNNSK